MVETGRKLLEMKILKQTLEWKRGSVQAEEALPSLPSEMRRREREKRGADWARQKKASRKWWLWTRTEGWAQRDEV